MNPYTNPEENPMTDAEWDAALIRDFESYGPVESATVEFLEMGGTGVQWAHENPEAWRIVARTEGRERTEQLIQIIRAAGLAPILPLWEPSTT